MTTIITTRETAQKEFISSVLLDEIRNFKHLRLTHYSELETNFEFDFYGEFDQLESTQDEFKKVGITIDGFEPRVQVAVSNNSIEAIPYVTFKCTFEDIMKF